MEYDTTTPHTVSTAKRLGGKTELGASRRRIAMKMENKGKPTTGTAIQMMTFKTAPGPPTFLCAIMRSTSHTPASDPPHGNEIMNASWRPSKDSSGSATSFTIRAIKMQIKTVAVSPNEKGLRTQRGKLASNHALVL